MNLSEQIAKYFREVYFGGNWTDSNLRDQLKGINYKQALRNVASFNTIVALTFHLNYFVDAVLNVLRGGKLEAHDKFSFDHPQINSDEDWNNFIEKVFKDAKEFASLVEKLPEEKMWEDFTDKKYGSYYRNLHGIIEHTHYHLGQIAIIKKLIQKQEDKV